MTNKRRHRKDPPRQRPNAARTNSVVLYGRHAVQTALANTQRTPIRLMATEAAKAELRSLADINSEIVDRARLDRLVPEGTPHQGLVLEAKPLPAIDLKHWLEQNQHANRLLAIDQVSDPRNLGAILRSAAAFNVDAVMLPERHSAELNGACARAAAGALDIVPIIQVGNLARSLALVKEHQFWTVGLDAEGDKTPDELPELDKTCVVLGAEDRGMRRLTVEHCDHLIRLPISEQIESLNVAVAAGIALYALSGS